MNIIALRDAKSRLSAVGRETQRGRSALVTRRGRPFLVIVGVEGEELIDVLIRWDPGFWSDLERRRARSRRSSTSLDELAPPPRKSKKRRRVAK